MVPALLISGLLLAAPVLYSANQTLGKVFVTPAQPVAADPANPAATALPLPDWNKKERVNILLLGLDKRPDDQYSRSDTIIIASIDPVAKTVGIMSLPRDLRVTIPGHGLDKINAAYVFGDADKYPGGGVGLLKRTIYLNFGINVHYFAQVDFRGFEKVVDTFGGVTVDNPYPLKDDFYPTETNGYVGIYFPAGLLHLDGKQALRYARTRHADNDFGRAARQQQVILALRQQAITRDLPSRFFQLLDVLGASVRTDLSVQQAAALAKLGQGIPRENIKSYSLQDLVQDYTDPDTGVDYLIADWTQVRQRVKQVVPNINDPAANATLPDPAVRIAVRNGSQVPLFASRSVDRLRVAGFAGAMVDPTSVPGRTLESVVYDYTGKGTMAFLVAKSLGLPETAVRDGGGAGPPNVDILVVLGEDAPSLQPRTPATPATPPGRSN